MEQIEQYENVFTTGEWGSTLWVRLYDPTTKKSRYQKIPNNQYIPPIYTLTPPTPNAKAEYKTFDTREHLYRQDFKNTMDLSKALKETNKEKAYGLMDRRAHYIREKFENPVDSNHLMRTMFIDIEVEVTENGFPKPENAREMITVIQLYDNFLKEYFILGTRKWTGSYTSRFGKVKYLQLKNENELLETFLKIVEKTDPTIISGFNSNPFDMPYLINRMKNLNIDYTRLSPVGEIQWKESITKDGFKYDGALVKGRFLVDYKDLIIKYAYLSIPTNSLENVAMAYDLHGKSKQESYTYQSFNGNYSGEGYVELIHNEEDVPEDELKVWKLQRLYNDTKNKDLLEDLQQAVFDTFMKYAIRDVELMLEINEKANLINLAQTVAYMSGVTIEDVSGTLKYWLVSMYNTAFKDKVILPMKQQYTEDCVYLAGWVRSQPGKYKYITSFDIGSAHPHQYVNHNIGADTIIKQEDLHPELVQLQKDYFNFFEKESYKNLTKNKKETNDLNEETDYYIFLLNNRDKIRPILEKHKVRATVNGVFYTSEFESYSSKVMRDGLSLRMGYKKKGKGLRAEIEGLKAKNLDIEKHLADAEYAELLSLAYKIRLNSYYGAGALKINPFSNGSLTGASVAMSTRAVNKIQAIAVDRTIKKFLKEEQDDTLSYIKITDTDSIYASLEKLVEKIKPEDPIMFCKNFSEKVLLPEILKLEKEFLDGLNVVDASMIKFDNEIVADDLVTIALKRYFANVKVADGTVLNKPKLKAVGISLISRTTPKGVKDILKPTLGIFLSGNEKKLQNYMKEALNKFKKLTPKDISGVVGVNKLDYNPFFDDFEVDDWKKANKFKTFNGERYLTAPLNSKGSIIYNHLLKDFNLSGKYEEIYESNKVNVVYLRVPNNITFSNNVIAFKDEKFLDDIGLTEYIDYEKQWEKEVTQKVEIIAHAIKWGVEEKNEDIDDW